MLILIEPAMINLTISAGNVYVADSGNNCIQKFDNTGKSIATSVPLGLVMAN